MPIQKIIMMVMAVFFAIGAIDHLLDNRLGFGKEFERAFSLMGTIALNILGLISISPVIARMLKPVVVPLYQSFGADAAMFAPTFLSVDSGGYSIATQLAADPQVGLFAGAVIAALFGANMSFTIPVAISIIEKEDHKFFSVGVMSGFIVIPFGGFIGGLACGLPAGVILINLMPVTVVAVAVIIGLIFFPEKMIKMFTIFAKFIHIIIIFGLTAAVIEQMTGFAVIKGMNPLAASMKILGNITIILAGTMSFIYGFMKVFKTPLDKIAELTGITDLSVLSMLLSLATLIPGFVYLKDMNDKGKIIFGAFAATTANIFGAHLGFISAVSPEMVAPMITAKVAAGVVALPIAALLYKRIFLSKKEGL